MTFVGKTCSSKNYDLQNTVLTFVHEVGHQLGMDHDFERRDGRDCSGDGHMSYGRKKEEWSSCSKLDFKNWWNTQGYACKNVEHGNK